MPHVEGLFEVTQDVEGLLVIPVFEDCITAHGVDAIVTDYLLIGKDGKTGTLKGIHTGILRGKLTAAEVLCNCQSEFMLIMDEAYKGRLDRAFKKWMQDNIEEHTWSKRYVRDNYDYLRERFKTFRAWMRVFARLDIPKNYKYDVD